MGDGANEFILLSQVSDRMAVPAAHSYKCTDYLLKISDRKKPASI